MRDGKKLFSGALTGTGVYSVELGSYESMNMALLTMSLDDWHERLGHVAKETIKRMA